MFKNYWVIAVRSLGRNRTYSIINFLGLTVGMAACLLLFLLVRYDTSFDTFHSKKDHIFRVISVNHDPKGEWRTAAVPYALPQALATGIPQVTTVAPAYMDGDERVLIDQGNGVAPKVMKENVFFLGTSFFKMFDFGSVEGDPQVLLNEPNKAMLTKSTAERFFGDWRSALGKTLILRGKVLVQVVGILQDPPANTDFPFKLVVSYPTLATAKIGGFDPNNWGDLNGNYNCYIELRPDAPIASTEQHIDKLTRSRHSKEDQNSGAGLQALTKMHYDTSLDVYSGSTISPSLVRALVTIGIFLLALACINFINLATAQAVNRAREVGVRKVLGSGRRQLVFRFLGETGIIAGLALGVALLVSIPLIGPLNALLGTKLNAAPLAEPGVVGFLIGLYILVTLLAGVYPALVLSGFNPVTALKSKLVASASRGLSLRRVLVVVQFVIAQVLITGVLVIVSQMNYFRHANMGFVKDAIITVPIPRDSISQTKQLALQDGLLRDPGVEAFSYSFTAPADFSSWSDFRYDHRTAKTPFYASLRFADTNYFSLYHLSFVTGRRYSDVHPNDSTREFVVNETCVRMLGLSSPQEALGHQLNFWDGKQVGKIVGVVKDYYIRSLKDSIAAVVMWPSRDLYLTANIKLQPARIGETLGKVRKAWGSAFPTWYFEYQFLDKKVANMYSQEEQLGTLYEVFAGIAIFISCLGLYGLISFLAVQRNKEIGIRKVMGASVWQMVGLLSKEFTILVFIAFVVATPVSWYFMHRWLENFAYRIPLTPKFYVLTATAAVLIAWMTVGYRAVRAAQANPADALRSE